MNFKKLTRDAALCGLLLLAALQSAQALTVTHSFESLGGGQWRASFAFTQQASLATVESVTLYLQPGQAQNLALPLAPLGWDPLVVQPDLALGSAGFLDVLALGPASAIAPGQTLAGFGLEFEWLAAFAPQGFTFTVNDPVTFAVLEQSTTLPGALLPVPEPATWALLVAGLFAVGIARRHH